MHVFNCNFITLSAKVTEKNLNSYFCSHKTRNANSKGVMAGYAVLKMEF